ncbi:BF3164 family lipoprotein [Algoriphagus sp. C2-6-M1]|uniref:BF3164 family lipoprotein n=1 Tax=Algoriphagus persicinus TaxID=3108754 RepID=UPI002B366CFA|nr:BF3164 family lipoprotein [Algoriphagus sp. C2-6-M1]MEB2779867.1 BF3164 family lipoprotein [Algoriphagus sp. C2-6-M1]
MRKFRLITLLLVFFVAFSCEKAQNEAFEEVEAKVELDKQETGIQVLSRGNVNLLVVDTLLIVQKSSEPFLEIYDTNTHKLLTTFGKHGEGPGEILVPVLIKQREFENESPIITVFDYERRIVNKINLSNLLTNKGSVLEQNPLPFKGNYVLYFFHADSDFVLGTTLADGRFTHYSYETDSIQFIPYIPQAEFEMEENFKEPVYRSTVTINKEKSIAATFPLHLGWMEFFDLSGNFLSKTYFEDPDKIKEGFFIKDEKDRQDSYMYVSDSDSDQNYIYGLNMNNNSSIYRGGSLSRKQIIEVFDWEGSHIKQYVLNDNLPSESFAFDEKYNRFYTYCRECEDSNLSYYAID